MGGGGGGALGFNSMAASKNGLEPDLRHDKVLHVAKRSSSSVEKTSGGRSGNLLVASGSP